MTKNTKELIGFKQNFMTIIADAGLRGKNNDVRFVTLQCDCGNIKDKNLYNFTRIGSPKSCGKCDFGRYHGLSRHPLMSRYRQIKNRCSNPNHKSYKDYGAKGVTVCKEWAKDFRVFLKWCESNGYKKDLQLDRIDPKKGYEPANCRFITQEENLRRSSKNYFITYKERTMTAKEWSRELGYPYDYIRAAAKTHPLNQVIQAVRKVLKITIHDGQDFTPRQLSDKYGLRVSRVRENYTKGLRGKDLIEKSRLI